MTELMRRYVVRRLATDAPFDPRDPDGAFVLKPWKDPAALRALAAYRDHCYPELARDLTAWMRIIEQGPAVRGDVGRRNEPYVARATGRRTAPHRPRRRGGEAAGEPRGARRHRRPVKRKKPR